MTHDGVRMMNFVASTCGSVREVNFVRIPHSQTGRIQKMNQNQTRNLYIFCCDGIKLLEIFSSQNFVYVAMSTKAYDQRKNEHDGVLA